MTDDDVTPAWIERIAALGALTPWDAARALTATLAILGEHLTADERNRVARALPLRAAAMLGQPRPGAHPATFYDRVALHEGIAPGFAREHAQTVGRVLVERLPLELVRRLARALDTPIRDLFQEAPPEGIPPEHAVAPSARHHTLATGAPGSAHPLSESAAPGAHQHSVGEENPHGATKLSSARGLTQERERESLSTEEPDERRTIVNVKA